MKRIEKPHDSPILKNGWRYNNQKERALIAKQLLEDQHNLCAYTETYFGRTDKREIDHFNPKLKNKEEDGYQNWFLVKAQWNNEKSSKWFDYQPILHPTDESFDLRITYKNGYYLYGDEDIAAQNLCELLKLNDPQLVRERSKYIAQAWELIEILGNPPPEEYFNNLIKKYPEFVYFRTAILAEFGVNPFQ